MWFLFHPLFHDIIFKISHISLDVEQWRIYLWWSLSTHCKMFIVVWLYILYHAYLFVTSMCLHAPLTISTQDSLNLNMTCKCCFHRARFSPSNFSFPIKSLFLDVVVIVLMYAFQSYYTTNMFNYIVAHLIIMSGPITKWTMARNILILTYMVWDRRNKINFNARKKTQSKKDRKIK